MAQMEYPTWTKCNDGWKVRIPADLYENYSEAGEFEFPVMKKSGEIKRVNISKVSKAVHPRRQGIRARHPRRRTLPASHLRPPHHLSPLRGMRRKAQRASGTRHERHHLLAVRQVR